MKTSNTLSDSLGDLAIAPPLPDPPVMLPSIVQNVVVPQSRNPAYQFVPSSPSSPGLHGHDPPLTATVARYEAEVRSLRQQLAEKEHLAAVGTLAASIVHEIRNPLTTLWMWLDYCQRQDLSEPDQKRLALAAADGDRLQRLLSQILLYAKPQTLHLKTVDLNQLVAETLEVLQQNPVALNRPLDFDPSHFPITLTADPDKLKQVLINLVTNACEAVSEGDRIRISVKSLEGDAIALQVHNGGNPIHPEHLSKLTEPFFTTKATGTGLGLAIVQQMIDAHGGSLKIESDPTDGTTVTVLLPRQHSVSP